MKKVILILLVVTLAMYTNMAKADFTFGEPMNLGPPINSSGFEVAPSISADGLEFYFHRPDDIWVARRETPDSEWGSPSKLDPPINMTPDIDITPCISADGLTLYFSSDRPGGSGDVDIWVTTRVTLDEDWGVPVNLGETVNSTSGDWDACISADGLELYFNSMRTGGHGSLDIWVSTRATTSDPWETPVNLGPMLNTSSNDCWPGISPDGLLLFFNSNRPGGLGEADLYVTRRITTKDPWGPPINLGPSVNSATWEAGSNVSFDGSMLYFQSPRSGGFGGGDLWQVPIIPFVDFNSDGIIDAADGCIMVEHWLTDYLLCDIGPMPWGDGIVDETDFNILMSHWGQDVSYLINPRQACQPTPLDHAISDVEQAVSIFWMPGRHAVQHDVYVGLEPIAVEEADTSDTTGIYRGRQEGSEYTLLEAVLPNQTFYWRIDEFNKDDTLTKGQVWSFSVADYLIIDDMESSEPAWERWRDGWGNPNNGSEAATEFTTVHSGNQAMWLSYNNSTAQISRVERYWLPPHDWTRKGVETLILWLHGSPDNTMEPLQISLKDSANNVEVVVHPDPAILLSETWQQWSIPLADFTNINLTEIRNMSIVIGDDATEEAGTGEIFIDDICLHPVSMQDMP